MRRVVGWQVTYPESVRVKVVAMHELVRDDEVSSRVAQPLSFGSE
ncbi:DUF6192 family protein [Actinoplanes regularis]|uniref:Uncharacterized protein n=1 Tax=Actinoplanes regularis TaxID=52697 RepID=A0A239FBH5_9ACTN|nr:hypothetical protein Are01nite_60020 [Actinoplanes regularis]SNS54249.1 hypothetical protein SAMN06264365_1183 [Actinoplanes regularis]